jgi:hypothetical protein
MIDEITVGFEYPLISFPFLSSKANFASLHSFNNLRAAVFSLTVRWTPFPSRHICIDSNNGFVDEITQLTRLYILWRWAYGEPKIPFDEARKLAQSVGIDLANSWNKGFIEKDKEFIKILGPSNRRLETLVQSTELIDILHRVLLLWNSGRTDEIVTVLTNLLSGKSHLFYRIAQAISESLPNESNEKKWLEGFLAGKSRISRELKAESEQLRLFE